MQATVNLCTAGTWLLHQACNLVTLSLWSGRVELTNRVKELSVFLLSSGMRLSGLVSSFNDWKSKAKAIRQLRPDPGGLCSSDHQLKR